MNLCSRFQMRCNQWVPHAAFLKFMATNILELSVTHQEEIEHEVQCNFSDSLPQLPKHILQNIRYGHMPRVSSERLETIDYDWNYNITSRGLTLSCCVTQHEEMLQRKEF
uniref:Uncharacterized protein n=1 Tax=Glossina austeni TaxID=7395 RepID=A0A1A9VE91_GLOAU